jgi:tRNA-splicing ligase RtcB
MVEIKKINDFLWEVDRDRNSGMNVPIHLYANDALRNAIGKDRTLDQAANASRLPSIVKHMLLMPDAHEGYSFPIGGVAAFDANEGIISPGAIGFDIGCGVRLIKTNLTERELRPKLGALMDAMFRNVPSGVGSKMQLGFTPKQLERITTEGVGYIVEQGYGFPDDPETTEEGTHMKGADFSIVSDMAKKRGLPQLGTLGAGNHFAEVQKVDKVFDEKVAKAYGLEEGMVVIMLHSGSRGYGHQICSDYIRILIDYQKKNNIIFPDPELSYAHIGSKEAESYWAAMCSAINFAFVNRQVMTHFIRKSFADTFKRSADELDMKLVYDLCHNTAKLEEHDVDGKRMKLYVHRKGATRAFGPGREEVNQIYRSHGQPVLIPGSMGTASYVLAGRKESMLETFGSSCHGAGRVMSRHQALREISSSKTLNEMKRKNIEIRVRSKKLVSEEAEWAYKNVDDVVSTVEGAKISNIVARMAPLGVTKG